MILKYDKTKWVEVHSAPVNTLQMFITDRCNMRCPGCFYQHRLGKSAMSMEQYQGTVEDHLGDIGKVIILGGEPTLHPDLGKMIDLNNRYGLRTTIYTNACKLYKLSGTDLSRTSIRIDIKDYQSVEVPAAYAGLPVILVFMLRSDNTHLLMPFAEKIEHLGFKKMFISGIRDIHETVIIGKILRKLFVFQNTPHV